MKILFGSIRDRIDLNWKLGFGLVRIHSDCCLELIRIRSDRFLTVFPIRYFRQGCSYFHGKISSDWYTFLGNYWSKLNWVHSSKPRLCLGFVSALPQLRLDYALTSISCEHCRSSRNNSHCAPRHVIYYFVRSIPKVSLVGAVMRAESWFSCTSTVKF